MGFWDWRDSSTLKGCDCVFRLYCLSRKDYVPKDIEKFCSFQDDIPFRDKYLDSIFFVFGAVISTCLIAPFNKPYLDKAIRDINNFEERGCI